MIIELGRYFIKIFGIKQRNFSVLFDGFETLDLTHHLDNKIIVYKPSTTKYMHT